MSKWFRSTERDSSSDEEDDSNKRKKGGRGYKGRSNQGGDLSEDPSEDSSEEEEVYSNKDVYSDEEEEEDSDGGSITDDDEDPLDEKKIEEYKKQRKTLIKNKIVKLEGKLEDLHLQRFEITKLLTRHLKYFLTKGMAIQWTKKSAWRSSRHRAVKNKNLTIYIPTTREPMEIRYGKSTMTVHMGEVVVIRNDLEYRLMPYKKVIKFEFIDSRTIQNGKMSFEKVI